MLDEVITVIYEFRDVIQHPTQQMNSTQHDTEEATKPSHAAHIQRYGHGFSKQVNEHRMIIGAVSGIGGG